MKMRLPFSRPLITGIVMIAVGVTMVYAGIWLATLHGSWYYWIAGAALLASGAMLLARRVHAAGGHGGLRTRDGDYVVAYALLSTVERTNATTAPSGSDRQGVYAANSSGS